MPRYIRIRGLARNGIRIKNQMVKNTGEVLVDLDDAAVRRDLQRHSAVGAYITVPNVSSSSTSPAAVLQGGVVTPQGTPDQTVDVSAGTLFNKSTGTYVDWALVDNQAHSAASGANPRKDIVQVNYVTGVVSKKDGTAAASPVAPDPDANNIVLAVVTRPTSDNTIASADIADVRPRS